MWKLAGREGLNCSIPGIPLPASFPSAFNTTSVQFDGAFYLCEASACRPLTPAPAGSPEPAQPSTGVKVYVYAIKSFTRPTSCSGLPTNPLRFVLDEAPGLWG